MTKNTDPANDEDPLYVRDNIVPTPMPRDLVVRLNDAITVATPDNWQQEQRSLSEYLFDAGRTMDAEFLLYAETMESFRARCRMLIVRF